MDNLLIKTEQIKKEIVFDRYSIWKVKNKIFYVYADGIENSKIKKELTNKINNLKPHESFLKSSIYFRLPIVANSRSSISKIVNNKKLNEEVRYFIKSALTLCIDDIFYIQMFNFKKELTPKDVYKILDFYNYTPRKIKNIRFKKYDLSFCSIKDDKERQRSLIEFFKEVNSILILIIMLIDTLFIMYVKNKNRIDYFIDYFNLYTKMSNHLSNMLKDLREEYLIVGKERIKEISKNVDVNSIESIAPNTHLEEFAKEIKAIRGFYHQNKNLILPCDMFMNSTLRKIKNKNNKKIETRALFIKKGSKVVERLESFLRNIHDFIYLIAYNSVIIKKEQIKIKDLLSFLEDDLKIRVNNFIYDNEVHNIKVDIKNLSSKKEIYTDKNILIEIIQTILQNAIEEVALSKTRANKINQLIGVYITDNSIFIQDTGRGIEEELREKIFERYYTTKASLGGTGIGLAVVKELCKKMDIDIKIKSNDLIEQNLGYTNGFELIIKKG